MGLISAYTLAPGQLAEFFAKLKEGNAPTQFSQQILKDLGYTSSNHRSYIPLLKALGFLSPDGTPTSIYHEYRDNSRSRTVMGQALKSAYSDLFIIKANPTKADKDAIEGKFKSYHNATEISAKRMASTFFALLDIADIQTSEHRSEEKHIDQNDKSFQQCETINTEKKPSQHISKPPTLHYNIQIHLPATKDIEVYNSIFKSIKEHLFEA
ncbi:MAG: DUF5343 domain-containing protein [Desulfovibrio sp.]|jgi:hypothetical protein|nr:DUF5343 domain-containing protein [Desulfovibrio sp.]